MTPKLITKDRVLEIAKSVFGIEYAEAAIKPMSRFAAALEAELLERLGQGFEEWCAKNYKELLDAPVVDMPGRRAAYQAGAANALRQQWQPIETAPKDGTEIIVCEAGTLNQEYVRYYDGGFLDRTSDEFLNPTHWMPLPAAPQDNEKMKGEEE